MIAGSIDTNRLRMAVGETNVTRVPFYRLAHRASNPSTPGLNDTPVSGQDEKGEVEMKRCISKAVLVATIALPAMSNAARAGGTDDFGCSNATLKGEYAFGVTAYTPPGLPNGPPRVVTGIRVYDGNGHFTQRDYQGDNLAGPDFAPPGQETGTYMVNPDCTGSDELDINAPVPSGSTGVIKVLFVISDGGRHIHEVVSQFTPPGFTEPQPTQTSADVWKVAVEREH